MTDKNDYWYLEREKKPSLYAWIFNEMARGAIYAFFAVMAVLGFIFVLIALSEILPEDPFAAELLPALTAAATALV
jgi:hypothetical protein